MSRSVDGAEEARRAFVLKALAASVLATGPARSWAQMFGTKPQRLPPEQSIYEASGLVLVGGQPVTSATKVGASDKIETGKGAQLIFVVGSDAFLLRENSKLELTGKGVFVSSMRLVTGALLSVFGSGAKHVVTPTASLGIRGTGLYVESEPDRTYGCTCYGEVLISAADDTKVQERIVSKHHDAPRYILNSSAPKRILPAPFINHTDIELALIEALVGRTTPFSLFDEDYGGARRY